MIDWDWRSDLLANTGYTTKSKAFKSFFMVPSFNILCWIRLMLQFQQRNTKLSRFLSRIISTRIIKTYGVHVSVLVKEIGPGLRLPHPTGIVIGEGTSIGKDVLILQNVTLGKKDFHTSASIPTIGDNVSILAGAVILGSIKIGNEATIGANAVVLKDIAANATAVGVPARVINHNT